MGIIITLWDNNVLENVIHKVEHKSIGQGITHCGTIFLKIWEDDLYYFLVAVVVAEGSKKR